MQAILDAIQDGRLAQVQAQFLITNNSKCGAVEKARHAGLPVHHISTVTHADAQAWAAAQCQVVREAQIDILVLAGYMKKIPAELLELLPNRIINIHPALLPAFGGPGHWGHHVHEAVVAAGARVSGPTVHFVDGEYDHGQIIAQRAIALESSDTPDQVAAKVLRQEHDLFWRVLQAMSLGQVKVQSGRVECPIL